MRQRIRTLFGASHTSSSGVSWQLVRTIIVDHFQSQRVLVEWASAAVVALFIIRDNTNATAVMSTWALYAMMISLYVMSVLADSAEQPFQVQRVLAVQSRYTFLSAYLIAANLVVYSCMLLLVAMSMLVAPLGRPSLQIMLASLPSMLLLIASASTCMLLLTPLVSTTLQRIVLLLIIAIPIAWDTIATYLFSVVLHRNTTHIQDALTTIFGVALWPSLHLFDAVVHPAFTRITIVSYTIHIVLIAAMLWLARTWYERKHIVNI